MKMKRWKNEVGVEFGGGGGGGDEDENLFYLKVDLDNGTFAFSGLIQF